jgi:hypothetical protein
MQLAAVGASAVALGAVAVWVDLRWARAQGGTPHA